MLVCFHLTVPLFNIMYPLDREQTACSQFAGQFGVAPQDTKHPNMKTGTCSYTDIHTLLWCVFELRQFPWQDVTQARTRCSLSLSPHTLLFSSMLFISPCLTFPPADTQRELPNPEQRPNLTQLPGESLQPITVQFPVETNGKQCAGE